MDSRETEEYLCAHKARMGRMRLYVSRLGEVVSSLIAFS